jgi:hypothetical protein
MPDHRCQFAIAIVDNLPLLISANTRMEDTEKKTLLSNIAG